MLTKKSKSDFDSSKKAEFYDEEDFLVADKQNKDKLKSPKPVKDLDKEINS